MPLSLDASVLIQASRYKYPMDIAPGFWEALAQAGQNGQVLVIRQIAQEEIYPGKDDLADWLRKHEAELVTDDRDLRTQEALGVVTGAVLERLPAYTDAAVVDFAHCADSWIIAHAIAHGHTVVHEEVTGHRGIRRVKIPDVCDQMKVAHIPTLDLLRRLQVRLTLM